MHLAPGVRVAEPYVLYGTEVSLYSGKVRAYLRFKGIPFEERLSTLKVYRQVIMPAVGRPIIPVVQTPQGEILQDTTVIIDRLEERYSAASVYPATPWQRLVALLFEVFGDEWLVMPAMHYRWQFKRANLRFILGEFGATMLPGWPRALQTVAGLAPAAIFGGKYAHYFGIGRPMHAAVERAYLGFLDELNAHLAHWPFLLGSRPSIGDFGLIAPLYAHLYRDPYPGRLMAQRAPHVAAWVRRMLSPEPCSGEFIADDRVPETLHPLLQRMFREQWPVLLDTAARVGVWCTENPAAERLPRVIGRHAFTLEGSTSERAVQPYAQWMMQRPVEYYQSLGAGARATLDPLLEQLGGRQALGQAIPLRLAYRQHRVVLDASPSAG
jgi:glutathione S-transferase